MSDREPDFIYDIDGIEKYQIYDDDRLLDEFEYLVPWKDEAWDLADAVEKMDRTDRAHLLAVTLEVAWRFKDGD